MAKKLGSEEVVDFAEALKSEMYINQALIDLLLEKGILTYDEIKELRIGSISN